jgi:hypothetical protein
VRLLQQKFVLVLSLNGTEGVGKLARRPQTGVTGVAGGRIAPTPVDGAHYVHFYEHETGYMYNIFLAKMFPTFFRYAR